MESFVHLRKGRTPRRLHADLDGLKDDELGRGGFVGRTANIYRRHDPTAYRVVGPLCPVDMLAGELKPSDAVDANGGPLLMFSNDECRVLLSRRHEPMPYYARHVDGDLLCFVHRGTGLLETEFGPLRYREGDWIYIPKACTWRHAPDNETTLLMIEASNEFRVPPPGPLGRHFPFDPAQATIPEPAPIDNALGLDGRDEYEVRLVHQGGPTTLFYQHNPIDVEGWRGDNFAFTFNIADYNVITSDSVHLPPTVHLFMQARGVYVMNFLPKPAEGVAGTERSPWYHRNVDYDEVAFFHGGSLYGVPMPAGMISHAPQGVHHGLPERARQHARRSFDEYSTVDWQVVAIDTRRRLTPSAEVLAHDLGQH
ncbi:homogentisate 1,2-dioxygenase [Mycobacterium simiae]|uniref:Homogentisate 1,2-dioxygenase n=1 Tax=Mycobacterium simiae TaxID=1784 RepID=A0A5B1BSY8_MYCSI|nr:homogentisate 1,2-dioxygenase [Mycobacterium simiae]KAA1251161.1 homogentisate 1,2-dioxygenase [Mycobacterium simiae]